LIKAWRQGFEYSKNIGLPYNKNIMAAREIQGIARNLFMIAINSLQLIISNLRLLLAQWGLGISPQSILVSNKVIRKILKIEMFYKIRED
jgi:hypothetical protein